MDPLLAIMSLALQKKLQNMEMDNEDSIILNKCIFLTCCFLFDLKKGDLVLDKDKFPIFYYLFARKSERMNFTAFSFFLCFLGRPGFPFFFLGGLCKPSTR